MKLSIHERLIRWVVLFVFLYSGILTLSLAVRERSWQADYRWSHWIGFGVWIVVCLSLQRILDREYPDRDPFLFPCVTLLTGWGMLTVWRLDSTYGLRQVLWLVVSAIIFTTTSRKLMSLNFLRRYKYLLLGSGIFLTALTLIFGTNPVGYGPRLWLGCCGIYFQPSEPLKLLFVIYLAAYLSDHHPIKLNRFPLLVPTFLVIGLALMILLIQRDLGTASLFMVLYALILYISTGQPRVLIATCLSLLVALVVGYYFVDLVRFRVEGWFNPWRDPTGNSYQIVQSLLAIASGGLIGRGPGLGNPGLVPVAISDFIFTAISEEAGLVGSLGLILVYLLIVSRGVIIALKARDRFQRLLAAGVSGYLGLQCIWILGGNLKILPLTGVTLPFVSYGGSSLLTSLFTLLILLRVEHSTELEPSAFEETKAYSHLAMLLGAGFLICAVAVGWWAIYRGPDLLTRSDNPRRSINDRYVPRGEIYDRNNMLITRTVGESGSYSRYYLYPDLSSVLGYTHPVFGQSGLEAGMDDTLRGLQGNPASLVWWEHLLYGTPPPGLDVRLSLDLALQEKADQLLGAHSGAVILMQAQTGEILVMASHPTFDANQLDSLGSALAHEQSAPLLNRATQGNYPPGTILEPFVLALLGDDQPSRDQWLTIYDSLGFYNSPNIRIPVADSGEVNKEHILISPLQLALAAASLSNAGTIPSARLALAVDTPNQGWVILPALDQPSELFSAETAAETAEYYSTNRVSYWQHTGRSLQDETAISWIMTGTLPDWSGIPMVAVVALEEGNTSLAEYIARELFAVTLSP